MGCRGSKAHSHGKMSPKRKRSTPSVDSATLLGNLAVAVAATANPSGSDAKVTTEAAKSTAKRVDDPFLVEASDSTPSQLEARDGFSSTTSSVCSPASGGNARLSPVGGKRRSKEVCSAESYVLGTILRVGWYCRHFTAVFDETENLETTAPRTASP